MNWDPVGYFDLILNGSPYWVKKNLNKASEVGLDALGRAFS